MDASAMDERDDALGTPLTAQRSLVKELQWARKQMHGHELRAVVRFECHTATCAVNAVDLHLSEGGGRKLFQPPVRCCRCGASLHFVNLSLR